MYECLTGQTIRRVGNKSAWIGLKCYEERGEIVAAVTVAVAEATAWWVKKSEC